MTRTTLIVASLLGAATFLAFPADAGINFPVNAELTECYEGGYGSGWCTGTGVRLFEDGTLRGFAGETGMWASFGGRFHMIITADYDGDGVVDYRHDYIGAPEDGCMTGKVLDQQTGDVGEFWVCP